MRWRERESRVSLRDAGTASDAVTYTPIATMLPRRERATLAAQRDAGVTRKGGWRWCSPPSRRATP